MLDGSNDIIDESPTRTSIFIESKVDFNIGKLIFKKFEKKKN